MPTSPTYSGVYVEEIPGGVRTITGVSASITALIGRTKRQPVDRAAAIALTGSVLLFAADGRIVRRRPHFAKGDLTSIKVHNILADYAATLTLLVRLMVRASRLPPSAAFFRAGPWRFPIAVCPSH